MKGGVPMPYASNLEMQHHFNQHNKMPMYPNIPIIDAKRMIRMQGGLPQPHGQAPPHMQNPQMLQQLQSPNPGIQQHPMIAQQGQRCMYICYTYSASFCQN